MNGLPLGAGVSGYSQTFDDSVISSEFFAGLDIFNLSETAMVVSDRAGYARRVNAAFERLAGRAANELVGEVVSWGVPPEDARRLRALRQKMVESEDESPVSCEIKLARPDRSIFWVDFTILPIRDDRGVVAGFLDQAVDITTRRHAEDNAARRFDLLEQAQHVAHVGSFEYNPRKSDFDASSELRRLLGLKESDHATIASLIEVIHPDDRERLGAAIHENLTEHTPVDLEHRLLLANGTLRWVHARVEWVESGPAGHGHVLGTVHDITDRKLAEGELAFQDTHDQLTGLSNRANFLEQVDRALGAVQYPSRQVAVLLLDIDDFKNVNDGLGHAIGDQVLIDFSNRLAASAQGWAVVARLGGDEFGLLVESGHAGEDVAIRIIDALRAPFTQSSHQVQLSASIGIAFISSGGDAYTLLRDADLAMYLAKQKGKGRYEVAQTGMRERALERFVTIEELQHGVEHHEFEVYFQAIVTTETSALVGAEALVRWNRPNSGLVSLGSFIELAEISGLIVPIGREVRRDACRQLAAWRSDGLVDEAFYVSVNLSARELADEGLVESVARDLADAGLPARALVLEVTENSLMAERSEALSRLNDLKNFGLRLALDDYGTGFSSLSRLADMPIDIVKIDKSFVDRLTPDGGGAALVKSVIDAAKALEMSTIAEGVEDEGQRRVLEDLGCTSLQGYLFAKPMPRAQAEKIFKILQGNASARFGEVADSNVAEETILVDRPPDGGGFRSRSSWSMPLARRGVRDQYSALVLNPSLVGALFPMFASACLLATLPFTHQVIGQSFAVLLYAALAGIVIGSVRFVFRNRLPEWTINIDVAIGDLFIILCILVAGAQTPYAIFFLWTSVIVALYFRPLLAMTHVGAVGVSYAFALWFAPSSSDPGARWILIVVSSTILSAITVILVSTLRKMSANDELTGLANRRAWDQRLIEEMERARRDHSELSLVMIDIDGFKKVNDRSGHLAGDRLLCDFATGLKDVVREGGDFLVRLGGDEFGVLAPNTSQRAVRRLAQRLEAAAPPGFSCSVGSATWESDESADELFHRADQAMYRAKQKRRTRSTVS